MLVVRDLEPEEFHRLEGHPSLNGIPMPSPEHARIIIAEEDGEIVGYQFILQVIHLEPIWVHEKYRGGTLAVRLFTAATKLLDDLRISVSYCFSRTDTIAGYLKRLGLKELSYRTFVYDPNDVYTQE